MIPRVGLRGMLAVAILFLAIVLPASAGARSTVQAASSPSRLVLSDAAHACPIALRASNALAQVLLATRRFLVTFSHQNGDSPLQHRWH
jgi:hypothetical protein